MSVCLCQGQKNIFSENAQNFIKHGFEELSSKLKLIMFVILNKFMFLLNIYTFSKIVAFVTYSQQM